MRILLALLLTGLAPVPPPPPRLTAGLLVGRWRVEYRGDAGRAEFYENGTYEMTLRAADRVPFGGRWWIDARDRLVRENSPRDCCWGYTADLSKWPAVTLSLGPDADPMTLTPEKP